MHLSALESQLLSQIQPDARGRHGLARASSLGPLTAAADQHSQSMAQKGYFSHDSANGGSFFKRIASFYTYRGYSNWSAGENLLYSTPDIDPAGALRLWLNSLEHRANLLQPQLARDRPRSRASSSAPGVLRR